MTEKESPKIDLIDLLPSEEQENLRQQRAEEKAKKEQKRTAHVPRNLDQPEALVLFWQTFHCSCGREYSAPSYHPSPTMVRILEKDGGEKGNSSYRYECPRPDHPSNLPLQYSNTIHEISSCLHCAGEKRQIPEEEQLLLFPEYDPERMEASTRNSRRIPGESLLPVDSLIPLEPINSEDSE